MSSVVWRHWVNIKEFQSHPMTQHCQTHQHMHRNRAGKGGAHPPTFQGGGAEGGLRPPPFWAHTYLKIPPRSLFFYPHNSTVLTPNQSVRRCFEKSIGVRTRGVGGPPVFLQCVCVGQGWPLMLEAPSGQFFSVQRYNILHNQCVSV